MSEKKKSIWTRKKVYDLIALYQSNECLWNCSKRSYKDRDKRVEVVKEICTAMEITKDQFARKIHNLRNQYIFELRKLQKIKSFDESSDECTSKWEYFDRLQFLRKYITTRPSFGETEHKVQASEDESSTVSKSKEATEVSASCVDAEEDLLEGRQNFINTLEPPIIFEVPKVVEINRERDAEIFQESEAPQPKKPTTVELGCSRDELEVFGQFVAMELRSLNSDASRKRLKRKIMQAILDVGNEDDGININIKLT